MTYKTNTNQNGDLAERIVELEIIKKGWIVSTPSSRDADYDYVVDFGKENPDHPDRFETIQVKKMTNDYLPRMVERKNQRTTKEGKVRNTVDYAERGIEWLAGVDIISQKIYWYKLDTYKDKPKKFKVTHKRHPPDTFPTNNNVRKNNE